MPKHDKKTPPRFELYQPPKVLVTTDKPYRISRYTIITLVLLFIGSLGLALTFAFITDTQHQITQVKQQIQEQKETNLALYTAASQRYTLDEVAKIATERMGMNRPDASQVIYIEVPKESYVVFNNVMESEEDETNYFVQGIIDFFKQFMN